MISIFIAFPLAGATWALFLLEHMTADLELIQETDEESPA